MLSDEYQLDNEDIEIKLLTLTLPPTSIDLMHYGAQVISATPLIYLIFIL